MPPDIKLEALHGGGDDVGVVGLAEHAEGQCEDRAIRIDGDKAMVSAFVGEDDEVGELSHAC